MQRKKVNDAHIKYIHLGNNRLPQRAVPRANRIEKWRSSPRKFNEESSKLFGFPVYYPPGRDQRRLDTREKKQSALKKIDQENTEQHRKEQHRRFKLRQEEKQDFNLYLYYASRFGPLDGVLYASSYRPGQVYAFVAHRMSRVLQLWLKGRMIALRECVSRELAQHTHDECLVKVCARVCQVREQERQIHINTRRLLLNFLVKCFQCWALYIEKVRRGKQLLRRKMQAHLYRRFHRWKTVVKTKHAIRQGQIQHASMRLFRRTLVLCFVRWKTSSSQSRAVKEKLARDMGRRKQKLFHRWRVQSTTLRHNRNAATLLQATMRGHLVRAAHVRHQGAATVIQRVVRGHVSRVQSRVWKSRVTRAETRKRAELLQLLMQTQQLELESTAQALAREHERLSRELAFVSTRETLVITRLHSDWHQVVHNGAKSELKTRVAVLQQHARERRGEVLSRAQASTSAKAQLREERRLEVAKESQEEFRLTEAGAPVSSCRSCGLAFGRPKDLVGHVCANTRAEEIARIEHVRQSELQERQDRMDQVQRQRFSIPELESYLMQPQDNDGLKVYP